IVPVSAIVQVRLRVGTAQKGSMKAVAGSGMASMSLASMLFQPRMEEPSKPYPSVKTSSVSSRMGQLKCCQVPKVSTNLMSTILAPLFLASSSTLLGVLMDSTFSLCQTPSPELSCGNRDGQLRRLGRRFLPYGCDLRFQWRSRKLFHH